MGTSNKHRGVYSGQAKGVVHATSLGSAHQDVSVFRWSALTHRNPLETHPVQTYYPYFDITLFFLCLLTTSVMVYGPPTMSIIADSFLPY